MTEENQQNQNTNETPEAPLTEQLVQTVLNHGAANHSMKLSDAMGALLFSAFEIYYASRHAPQNPAQPEGGDTTETGEPQPSASDQG